VVNTNDSGPCPVCAFMCARAPRGRVANRAGLDPPGHDSAGRGHRPWQWSPARLRRTRPVRIELVSVVTGRNWVAATTSVSDRPRAHSIGRLVAADAGTQAITSYYPFEETLMRHRVRL
jgi:hypothetical protein